MPKTLKSSQAFWHWIETDFHSDEALELSKTITEADFVKEGEVLAIVLCGHEHGPDMPFHIRSDGRAAYWCANDDGDYCSLHPMTAAELVSKLTELCKEN